MDGSGNVWVADWDNARIAKYNAEGVYQTSFGQGVIDSPTGVTIDSSGNFYVSNYWDSRVYKFDSAGNNIPAPTFDLGGYGSADNQFKYPQDVMYNPSNGYIYVMDQWNHKVKYFTDTGGDPNGGSPNSWGQFGTAVGDFKYPQGIGVDASGNIYVADSNNHRIQKFSAAGTNGVAWGGAGSGSGNGQFKSPQDVAVDGSGNIWVADTNNHRVQKLSPSGTFITKFGSSGSGQGQFSYPRGVAVNFERVYAVDSDNSRLQAYDLPATAGWAYNQIGNMTLNDGRAYSYGTRPHAVTQAGTSSYTYDANGSMSFWGEYFLNWDVENRMSEVEGYGTYLYDGDGFRVKKNTIAGNTVYAGKHLERNTSNGTVTLYYYLGDKMVAYREIPQSGGAVLRYLIQDHLGSTSLTTDSSGVLMGSTTYKPYGEARTSVLPLPAQRFTGQRLDDIGLYYYKGRYYDASLARFISPDPVVPRAGNPQNLNRYSYVLNNPLKYIDPTGFEQKEVDRVIRHFGPGRSSTVSTIYTDGTWVTVTYNRGGGLNFMAFSMKGDFTVNEPVEVIQPDYIGIPVLDWALFGGFIFTSGAQVADKGPLIASGTYSFAGVFRWSEVGPDGAGTYFAAAAEVMVTNWSASYIGVIPTIQVRSFGQTVFYDRLGQPARDPAPPGGGPFWAPPPPPFMVEGIIPGAQLGNGRIEMALMVEYQKGDTLSRRTSQSAKRSIEFGY
ncbi:MAG: hypothetical protein HY673_06580 [Chloroflexi bacterium]|nr:hypothetical protein [Chloroflexota bacterium]